MGSMTMTVGNAEIVALTDMNVPYPTPLEELWPNVPVKAWDDFKARYPETFEGKQMRLEIGCYLVRSQGRTILIDTGYGPGPVEHIGGFRGQLMANLASKKVSPGDVDTVFISHLHFDHVGWNTTNKGGKWVPTFPNARYAAHQEDLDHFRRPEIQAASHVPYMDSHIEPLIESGVFDVLSDDTDLTGEVKAIHTPGHTPGHMSILVASQGHRALIQGDAFVHPSQITNVQWNSLFDADSEVATETRRKLLEYVEADNIPVISCHFATPGFGRIVRYEGKRYWQAGL